MNVHDTFFTYWNKLEQHKDWIDLGMGMPPVSLFFPASEFQADLIQGIHYRTNYQPQAGSLALRKVIAEYETARTGVEYTAENIMLVAGAIRGFSLTVDTLTTPLSKLVEIAPTYPLLSGHARYAAEKYGCDIVTVTPRDTVNFTIEEDEILPHITESTILYLTNPSNPTGLYMADQTLINIIAACEKTHSYVIIDESCDIPLSNTLKAGIHQNHSSSLVRIQSLSKTLLLAGFRAGYIIADGKMIENLSSHYAFSDANAPLVFNDALINYFQTSEALSYITQVARDKVRASIEVLQSMPKVKHIINPEGCYYIFLKLDFNGGSWNLFNYLLQKGVNVVPGVLFGVDDRESWIRIGCGHDDDTLDEGLARLKHALDSL